MCPGLQGRGNALQAQRWRAVPRTEVEGRKKWVGGRHQLRFRTVGSWDSREEIDVA